jgi:hypothetical protein
MCNTKIVKKILYGITVLSLLFTSMGCEKSTVIAPDITPLNQSQAAAVNGLKILSMSEKANSFKKISTMTELIKKSQGGTIVLNHYNYTRISSPVLD